MPALISQQLTPDTLKSTNAKYTIIIRNRNPITKPRKKVEVEIFLSGYGIPEKNKLYVQLSSPHVLDDAEPGFLTSCIGVGKDASGRIFPVAGKAHLQSFKLTKGGATVVLNAGNFLPRKAEAGAQNPFVSEVRGVMAEGLYDDGIPPLLLSIKIAKKAKAGDYDATFTLTYGKEEGLLQDHRTVQFHITNWWERNKGWLTLLGVIIALLSLINAAFGPNGIWKILSWILKIVGLN